MIPKTQKSVPGLSYQSQWIFWMGFQLHDKWTRTNHRVSGPVMSWSWDSSQLRSVRSSCKSPKQATSQSPFKLIHMRVTFSYVYKSLLKIIPFKEDVLNAAYWHQKNIISGWWIQQHKISLTDDQCLIFLSADLIRKNLILNRKSSSKVVLRFTLKLCTGPQQHEYLNCNLKTISIQDFYSLPLFLLLDWSESSTLKRSRSKGAAPSFLSQGAQVNKRKKVLRAFISRVCRLYSDVLV